MAIWYNYCHFFLIISILGFILLFAASSCKKDKMVKPSNNTKQYRLPSNLIDKFDNQNIWKINDDEDEPLDRQ